MSHIEIAQWKSELDYQFELASILVWMWFTCKQNCTITFSLLEDDKYEYYKDKKIDRQTRKKIIVDILAIKWSRCFIIEMKKSIKDLKKCKNQDQTSEILNRRSKDTSQIERYRKTWLPVFLCYWTESFWEIIRFANSCRSENPRRKFNLIRKAKDAKK